MDKSTDKLVGDFIATVAKQNPNLVTAYLFGSYSRKTENADSDIDIALVLDQLKDEEKFDAQVQLMLLASQFDSRIEPHPLSKDDFYSGNPFAVEIRRTGREIKLNT